MIWPFRRKPKPLPRVVIDTRTANDWKPGDDALCIHDDWLPCDACPPKKGEILRVVKVVDGTSTFRGFIPVRGYYLVFANHSGGWHSHMFRRLVRDTGAADTEFTTKLKGKAPKVGAQ